MTLNYTWYFSRC